MLANCGDLGFDGDPAAVQWTADRYDLFWFRSQLYGSTRLIHELWNGACHQEDLGPVATSATTIPAVGSWPDGHLDIMWRDSAGDLRRRIFDRAKRNAAGYDANGWQLTDVAVAHGLPNVPIAIAEPAVNDIVVAFRSTGGYFVTIDTTNGSTFAQHNYTTILIDSPPALASWAAAR